MRMQPDDVYTNLFDRKEVCVSDDNHTTHHLNDEFVYNIGKTNQVEEKAAE